MPGANTSDWYSLIGKGMDNLSAYFIQKNAGEQAQEAAPVVAEQTSKMNTMLFVIVLILIVGFFFFRRMR